MTTEYGQNADLPQGVRDSLKDDALQTVFRTAFNSHRKSGESEIRSCVKAYRALEYAGAIYADGAWKSVGELRIYEPPAEVIEAAKSATEPGELTALLAAGSALTESEIRKVALHFAKSEGVPDAAWGGRLGLKWAGRVMRKLHAEKAEDQIEVSGEIVKVDATQHLVFGWASIVSINGNAVIDTQGDVISPSTIELSAYDFVLTSRVGGVMHEEPIGLLVESWVCTPEKVAAMLQSLQAQGISASMNMPFVGWWLAFKVTNEETWARVQSGELKAFSVGGSGQREKLAA